MVDVKTNFLDLIEDKNWKTLKKSINELVTDEVVELFDEISENDKIILFRLLKRKLAKEVFEMLSHEEQDEKIGRAHV